MSKQRIVVVGNGMVGHKFIETLLASSQKEMEIITFSEEPRLAYDRVQLTSYLTGKTADDLALTTEDYYQQNGVKFVINEKVIRLDCAKNQILTDKGRIESYDKLILATGSYPFVPPIPGNDQEHCHVYRTLEDLEAIKSSSKKVKQGWSLVVDY